jgi:hypothetical protein
MTKTRTIQGKTDRRQRMIRETERFLARHLPSQRDRSRRQHVASADASTSPVDKLTKRPHNGDGRSEARAKSRTGAWVAARVTEHGELDEQHLGILTTRLYKHAHFGAGDILVDLTDVKSATSTLHKVMGALRRYLARQNRRLLVLGHGRLPDRARSFKSG